MKIALVVGTSRRHGNTWGLVEAANAELGLPVIDLSELAISCFDYGAGNLADDFIPTVEKLLQFDSIGLVSPVYWYSVSAQMKIFIDRFSDLLGPRRDLLARLEGKGLFLLATGGTDPVLPQCMEDALRMTANYLQMRYHGSFYTLVEKDLAFAPGAIEGARAFLRSIGRG